LSRFNSCRLSFRPTKCSFRFRKNTVRCPWQLPPWPVIRVPCTCMFGSYRDIWQHNMIWRLAFRCLHRTRVYISARRLGIPSLFLFQRNCNSYCFTAN
jgi:hypothetical protein